MIFRVSLAFVLLLAASHAKALSASDQQARDVATTFLALVDAGRYEHAFHTYTARVRNSDKLEDFKRRMTGRRAPLGRPVSRAFYKVTSLHELPGAPDGSYQRLIFKTQFTRKAAAFEGVIVTHESGHWEVSGYGFK